MLQEQLGTNDYQIIVRTEMGKVQDVNSTANIAHTFFPVGTVTKFVETLYSEAKSYWS